MIGSGGQNAIVSVDSFGTNGTITGVSILDEGTNFTVGDTYHVVGVITATTITNNLLGAAGLTSSTTPTSGSIDDGFWELSMPFNTNYTGFSTSTVYVGSNNYYTPKTRLILKEDNAVIEEYSNSTDVAAYIFSSGDNLDDCLKYLDNTNLFRD